MCYCGGCERCLADQGLAHEDSGDPSAEKVGEDMETAEAKEFRIWIKSLGLNYADTDKLAEVA